MVELRRMRPLLGTYVEFGVHAASAADAERGLRAAVDAISLVQSRMSFHDPASDLSRLNIAPDEAITVHPLTLRVLRLAKAAMLASGGRFDPTVGGELVRRGILPDHGGHRPMPRGAASDIVIGRSWARLRRPVRLTLDGIAKGFAVDHAVARMRGAGAQAGWVNAGGDLRVFGDIALPVQRRELDGSLTALGQLRDAAVASSGVADEGARDESFPAFIVAPGERRPEPGVWTVLARSAWRADALTKVAANSATADRAEVVRRLGGYLLPAARTQTLESA